MKLSKNATFDDIVKYISINLEGGYYHPDMLKDGRVKDQRYKNSGETLWGIDRKVVETPEEAKFWAIIDNYGARKKWKWNEFPLNENLFKLASQIIKKEFDRLMNKYVSTDLQRVIYSNPLLLLNFVYAVYNGAGWFRAFAEKIQTAYDSGNHDAESLNNLFNALRKNNIGLIGNKYNSSLIAQTGNKISNINLV